MDEKRILVVTWFENYNYGTVLQAFSMEKILTKLEFNPYFLEYKTKKNIRTRISNKIRYLIYWNRRNIVKELSGNKFVQFRKKVFKTEQYEDDNKLVNLNKTYHVFLCGSDQIWSPSNFDSHYFLDFVNINNRRIAYAPSMGGCEFLNKSLSKRIIELISKFDFVSVRERKAADFLIENGIEAFHTMDPTMLIKKEEWEKMIGECIINRDYILLYLLTPNRKYKNLAEGYARRNGLKLIILPTSAKDLTRNEFMDGVGPLEFVNLIANARCVFTDSFHGTVFSIIHNKDFYTFERFKKYSRNNQNERIYCLLNQFKLMNRIVDGNNLPIMNPIKYEEVNKKIEKWRAFSYKFLNDSLS